MCGNEIPLIIYFEIEILCLEISVNTLEIYSTENYSRNDFVIL